ncbi:alpha/beta hydrolase [Altererythrobacter sp. Root672]|uniref:alpha/beta hydrolase n=1 Tax=Altererythrobacter sp. Root672 TaxID=1736584 RepID=UPI0006F2B191|nr:alpha/beta hydrolase [Altererythrobacter sp. Root672]KRA82740.1 arylesterase [Altererythrobacter sp. Root672]
MSISRHLVDPEIGPLLELPSLDLTAEALPEIRANPMFTGAEVPPPPFPVSEAYAPVSGGPDVRLVVMNPPSQAQGRATILHIHGGGMVVGTADRAVADKPALALEHDCVVVSVDYRLAPETPFPGPQEDNYAALLWLADNAASLGVDPKRIVVMGESAGGGLAASLALMTRDRGGPKLAGQVLIYPMLDWRTGGPDDRYSNRHTGEFIWTREKNRFGWEALRGDYQPADTHKGWFSPALAEDLSGLAPAYIGTGALDLFLDEDLDYARRLIDCGVQTELHVYPGAIHAFEMVPGTGLAGQAAMDLRRGLERLFR